MKSWACNEGDSGSKARVLEMCMAALTGGVPKRAGGGDAEAGAGFDAVASAANNETATMAEFWSATGAEINRVNAIKVRVAMRGASNPVAPRA